MNAYGHTFLEYSMTISNDPKYASNNTTMDCDADVTT